MELLSFQTTTYAQQLPELACSRREDRWYFMWILGIELMLEEQTQVIKRNIKRAKEEVLTIPICSPMYDYQTASEQAQKYWLMFSLENVQSEVVITFPLPIMIRPINLCSSLHY